MAAAPASTASSPQATFSARPAPAPSGSGESSSMPATNEAGLSSRLGSIDAICEPKTSQRALDQRRRHRYRNGQRTEHEHSVPFTGRGRQ